MNTAQILSNLKFTCTRCGQCCTGAPGFVWLSLEDIKNLVKFLNVSTELLRKKWCRECQTAEGKALSLKEKSNYDCIFLENGDCSVYTARPVQCRTYPFWDSILNLENGWSQEASNCPGIGCGNKVDPEIIAEALHARRASPILAIGMDEKWEEYL